MITVPGADGTGRVVSPPLARFGYRVRALNSDTSEEAPHELKNWFRQRVRWQKGWMQTLIVHARQPSLFRRDLGPSRACIRDATA